MRRLGAEPWLVKLAKPVVRLDTTLQRSSDARVRLLALVGLDSLLLTTTGRRSGLPRTVALLYARAPEGYLVAGSNWGGPRHPAWSSNLIADPSATVSVGGHVHRVTARLLADGERDRLWPLLVEQWPAYDTYAERAGRDIRVFLLVPAGA